MCVLGLLCALAPSELVPSSVCCERFWIWSKCGSFAGPVINFQSWQKLEGISLISWRCEVYLSLRLNTLMGNERLNETFGMFRITAHVLWMSPWTIWVTVLLNTSCFLLHRRYVSRCLPQRFKSGLPKAPVPSRTPVMQLIAQFVQECSKYPNVIRGSRSSKVKKQENIFLFLQLLLSWAEDCFYVPSLCWWLQTGLCVTWQIIA